MAFTIHETEAYIGAHDLACHGRFGRTERTAAMFLEGGHWYVYLIYGMHWMLNAVTGDEGSPEAVLLRGAGPATGPGKLCKALAVDRGQYGLPIEVGAGLWVAEGELKVQRSQIVACPRVGVDYAGEWKDKPYRFLWPRRPE